MVVCCCRFQDVAVSLGPLDEGPGLWFDANAFSPDGERLLATRGADLVVLDIASGRTIPLTTDGVPDAIENGHRASWSPDGKWIAYIQSDSSAVPKRAVLVPGDATYRTFKEQRYERIGGPISTFRIGIVGVEGGPTRWIELADNPGTFYLSQASWAGSSDELLVEKLSRYRDAREFLLVNHRTGAIAKAFAETDPAWADSNLSANGGLEWIRGGQAFVINSERAADAPSKQPNVLFIAVHDLNDWSAGSGKLLHAVIDPQLRDDYFPEKAKDNPFHSYVLDSADRRVKGHS